MTNKLALARKKAWETRRKKYGAHGHRGIGAAYGRPCSVDRDRMKRMEDCIIDMHRAAVLSEGQTAKVLGMHRIAVRDLVHHRGGYIE